MMYENQCVNISGGIRELASTRDFLLQGFHFRPTIVQCAHFILSNMGGLK